ncbi:MULTISPECIES: LLM class flavin-dependent oxidoreductase [Amycolatopsis]|uniref:Flavin-dependent oxidoreductase, luciferase family (Includes alkanesulfonate monooxygenase SsuD and methylene tetrahydromethanopterin reductase) n=2 Tax=Amycolatopsis TaxID=1813 RepID=A0A1I4DGB4_9PSEU|nr:LLM class flavin-dependent oxidoreductase [Amycolatopsis sacchari]SFK92245.1 Flavin-dependent oxidoreductase, luciferase family (includes alkanesulfonate monooxygenase SsuD and methylene tetrahydromethanopterin reductase) [Amycolatopsis sacchari]
MPQFSVHVPYLPARVEQIAPVAELVRRSSGARLWLGQSLTLEPHQLLAYCAGLGIRVPVGTSVTLMPLRHPYEAALQARSLALLTGHPLVAGYGPGPAAFQQALLGSRYRSPLTAVREYLMAVRGLLAGELVVLDGEYVTLGNSLPPMPHPPVSLGVGVLRPAMARLAGQLADVAITWLCPPGYLKDVLVPEIRRAAEEAGRPAPHVVSVAHLAERKPRRDPVALALSVCGAHLVSPHYVDMLNRAGVPVSADDPAAGARALVDGGVFLSGSVPELVEGLDAYRTAGVDEVVLNLSAVGQDRGGLVAVRELEFLLSALAMGVSPHRRASPGLQAGAM